MEHSKKFLERGFRRVDKSIGFWSVYQALRPFIVEVNSPLSRKVLDCLDNGHYTQYLELSIDPSEYDNPEAFALDYQVISLFKKAEFFPSVFNTKREAEVSFIEAEASCRKTNTRFMDRDDPRFRDREVSGVLYTAARKISHILGKCPSVDELPLRFGPGVNVGLSTTTVIEKLSAQLRCTENLTPYAAQIMASCPAWSANLSSREVPTTESTLFIDVEEVEGSKLAFVPKTAKTDRAICVEPLLNSVVQLGIGRVMRGRLKRAGCNLNDQSRNQELARIGSITDELATIDLSSASDTISYMVVLELLPEPWFNLLESCRCPRFTYAGRTFSFEKFSSMGNGATFELESLIFLALSRACCDILKISSKDVSVYGDDIIIPRGAASLLQKVLDFCGFKVNESKSFYDGPFRESCGKDWFLGKQVRPLFLKHRVSPSAMFTWLNVLKRSQGYLLFEGDPWYTLYQCILSLVPKPFQKITGPDGYGDGHIVVNLDEYGGNRAHSHQRRGWEGVGFFSLTSTPLSRKYTTPSVFAAALYEAQFLHDGEERDSTHENGYYFAQPRDRTRTRLTRMCRTWHSI